MGLESDEGNGKGKRMGRKGSDRKRRESTSWKTTVTKNSGMDFAYAAVKILASSCFSTPVSWFSLMKNWRSGMLKQPGKL